MTAFFALALILGVLALLAWIAATSVAASVEGWQSVDPERRFGRTGRLMVAGVISFGLAGMSASYAGWNSAVALLTAVVGAGLGAGSATLLGPAD